MKRNGPSDSLVLFSHDNRPAQLSNSFSETFPETIASLSST